MPRKIVTRASVSPVPVSPQHVELNLNIVEDDAEVIVPIILEQLENSHETRRHTLRVVSKKGLARAVWVKFPEYVNSINHGAKLSIVFFSHYHFDQ